MKAFPFSGLSRADLVVDATYEGGRSGNAGDDPLPQLLRLSNQGGFRYLARIIRCAVKGAIPQRVRIPPGNCRSSR